MRQDYPSHETVLLSSGPRKMKETLSSRYMQVVEPFLQDGVIKEITYRKTLEAIHSSAVAAAISRQGPNRVLQGPAPAISASEQKLPLLAHSTLAQLRDDRCCKLKTYLYFIKKANDDLCPECQTEAYSVNHIFRCPAYPTSLRPIDLWKNPITAARFLRTVPSFSDLPSLPDLPPPLDLPPPDPPP
jgi:hypothetical protein